MPTPDPEILERAESRTVRLVRGTARSSSLVRSFHRSSGNSPLPDCLGRIARRERFTLVGTRGSRSASFDGLTPQRSGRILAPLLAGHERVVTIGAGLGGFLAICAAGALGCESLAFAPRVAVPPLRRERPDALASAEPARDRHRPRALPPGPHDPVVVHDPTRIADARFVWQRLTGHDLQARMIAVPGAGHSVAPAPARVGGLAPIVRAVLRGRPLRTVLDAVFGTPRSRAAGARLHHAQLLIISGADLAEAADE